MFKERLVFFVVFCGEFGVWDVGVGVLGVEVWLACFDSKDGAVDFINSVVSKLKGEAKFYTDFEVQIRE